MRRAGLTMIEMLVVIVILGILVVASMFAMRQYLSRAQDAERKANLQTYRTVFEDYFSDHGRYPDPSVLQNCGGTDLQPYLPKILCDPATNTSYFYQIDAAAVHFGLYTNLENEEDDLVASRFCQNGCGPDINGDGESDFNLGLTDAGAVTGIGESTTMMCSYEGSKAPTCYDNEGDAFCFPGSTNCCGGSTCSPDGQSCYASIVCEEG